jgi:hypothetical protein
LKWGKNLKSGKDSKNYSGAATNYSGTAKIVPQAYTDTLLNKAHDSREEDADTLLEKVNVFGAGLKLRGSSPTIKSNTPENIKKEAPTRRTVANPLVVVNGNLKSQKEKEVKGPTTCLLDEDYDDDLLPPFKREAPTHRPGLKLRDRQTPPRIKRKLLPMQNLRRQTEFPLHQMQKRRKS